MLQYVAHPSFIDAVKKTAFDARHVPGRASDDDSEFLFVYGTLQRSEPANRILGAATFEGRATIRGTLYSMGPYPAVVLAGEGPVRGEVWRCASAMFAELDQYEGVDEGLFLRKRTESSAGLCWVYVAGPAMERYLDPSRILAGGDWLRRGAG